MNCDDIMNLECNTLLKCNVCDLFTNAEVNYMRCYTHRVNKYVSKINKRTRVKTKTTCVIDSNGNHTEQSLPEKEKVPPGGTHVSLYSNIYVANIQGMITKWDTVKSRQYTTECPEIYITPDMAKGLNCVRISTIYRGKYSSHKDKKYHINKKYGCDMRLNENKYEHTSPLSWFSPKSDSQIHTYNLLDYTSLYPRQVNNTDRSKKNSINSARHSWILVGNESRKKAIRGPDKYQHIMTGCDLTLSNRFHILHDDFDYVDTQTTSSPLSTPGGSSVSSQPSETSEQAYTRLTPGGSNDL